jgi:glycosyltransferase 2 family protein
VTTSNARLLLPFVFSAVLLALVVKSIWGGADQLGNQLQSANWPLLVPAILLYFVAVWMRSLRWGLLVPEYAVKTSTLFSALLVGFTVNNLLPLRMGEVARVYLLARWARVAYTATLASLIVERVLDGLSLGLLLLVGLLIVPNAPGYLWLVGVLAAGGFFACAALLALTAWRTSALVGVARFFARWLPDRLGGRMTDAAASMARSLALVHDPLRLARLLLLSIVAWCTELSVYWTLMFSVKGISATYPLALLVGSAANFATLLPSAPGYAGTFDQALTRVAQDALQIDAGVAGAYLIIVRATLFLPVVVVGTLVLWRSHISFGQLTHVPKAADSQYTPLKSGA